MIVVLICETCLIHNTHPAINTGYYHGFRTHRASQGFRKFTLHHVGHVVIKQIIKLNYS